MSISRQTYFGTQMKILDVLPPHLKTAKKQPMGLCVSSFVGMLLLITYCASCSNEPATSSYVHEQVEYLKRQTAPSDASVRETAGIVPKGQSVSAQWEFDTSQARGEYLDWATRRLQSNYALESSDEARRIFGKHLGGDYESVTIQTISTKESLHVKVTYVIFPD